MERFSQITVSANVIVALDKSGRVWVRGTNPSKEYLWVEIPQTRYEGGAEPTCGN